MVVTQVGGTVLDRLVDVVIPPVVVSWLNVVLFQNVWLFVNRWSFVHFFAGVLFYKYFPKGLKCWVWVNVVFEVVEFGLAFGGHPLFVEEFVDIVWDVLFSVLGFLVFKYWREGRLW